MKIALAKIHPTVRKVPLRFRFRTFRPAHFSDHRAGFTLIEILVATAIIGVLAAIATTNFIGYRERARVAVAIADMKAIEAGLYSFYADFARFPDSLAEAGIGAFNDPWGNPYQYLRIAGAGNGGRGQQRKDHFMVPVNSDFDLYSMGEDGSSVSPFTAAASRDDVVRAYNGGYMGKVDDM